MQASRFCNSFFLSLPSEGDIRVGVDTLTEAQRGWCADSIASACAFSAMPSTLTIRPWSIGLVRLSILGEHA
jgi:hypothetical protein